MPREGLSPWQRFPPLAGVLNVVPLKLVPPIRPPLGGRPNLSPTSRLWANPPLPQPREQGTTRGPFWLKCGHLPYSPCLSRAPAWTSGSSPFPSRRRVVSGPW